MPSPVPSSPRIWSLEEAKAYLHGMDPRELGVAPITPRPLRFDRIAIDRKLDAMNPDARGEVLEANDNEEEGVADELAALKKKVENRAAGA